MLTSRVRALTAAAVLIVGLGTPAVAFAQVSGGVATASGAGSTIPPEVENTTLVPTTAVTPTTGPEVLDVTVNNNLAFTGADVAGLSAVAVGAIAAGALLLGARRRRAASV